MEGKGKMEESDSAGDCYSTDSSSDNFYKVPVNMNRVGKNAINDHAFVTGFPSDKQTLSSNAMCMDSSSTQTASLFGLQFNELIMRALMQSTVALIGPPHGVISAAQGGVTGIPLNSTQGLIPASTWNEVTYHKSAVRRKRKPEMKRTSAGENSDSQENFRVPENESPQQRSLRTRRLNRFRASRAKELTNNRKAVNKLPYVIHVDGLGKAKGIHRHQWRAALRGQCGRLDPTMDNINHHPKQVVDSIWHALEKEWEFEGFAHRAREMFERSATKLMRNRKMQLKYKCQKNVKSSKPDDVSPAHWAKIEDITKKSGKQSPSSSSLQSTPSGKERITDDLEEDKKSPLQLLGIENHSQSKSPNGRSRSDSVLLEEDDVDARIRSLERELLRLQKSRKAGFCVQGEGGDVASIGVRELAVWSATGGDFQAMKENLKPLNENAQGSSEITLKKFEADIKGKAFSGIDEKKRSICQDAGPKVQEEESAADMQGTEMECGDVVHMFAMNGGTKKEIGKGILMGLAGSKFARKVIPKGWRSIKVTSITCNAVSEACPFPAGWADQVKHETVRDAMGRSILWPDTLLQSLLPM